MSKIEMKTPGGTVCFDVPVMQSQLYIFSHERRFEEYDRDNVREGVKSVMGGRVLEYEAKTILNEGMKQGVQQGLQEGAIKKAKETAWNLHALGMDDNTIADVVNVQVSLVKEWFSEENV